jgi:glutathione S-transferase
MITVHHLNNSRSQRVLWLLEELELPYEIVKYERDAATMLAPPELRKVHPLGKSPVITDGDATLAESGAILEYLVETYGNGRMAPARGTADHHLYRYFMHYAEGSLMPFLLLQLILSRVKRDAPFLIRPIARKIADTVSQRFVGPNLSTHFAFLEEHLAKRDWFAGATFTAADIQMSYPVESAVARTSAVAPRLAAWVERAKARPAYRRAIERGGPYELLG